MKRVLLVGGGTGGHIMPLIAVAEEMQKAGGVRLDYMGPRSQFLSDFETHGIKCHTVPGSKMRRYFSLANIFMPFELLAGFIAALFKLYFIMPDAVFSKGGPGALAVLFAARFYFIPIVVHESDSIPGITNRISGSFAKKVVIALAPAAEYFKKKRVVLIGNPVRSELLENIPAPESAKAALGFDAKRPLVFFVGGSQGAARINQFVVENLPEFLARFQVVHQSGNANFKDADVMSRSVLNGLPDDKRGDYKLFGFMAADEIKNAYAAADIVVSRTGASSIAEIAVFGKPAILVPIPASVAGEHQVLNASEYARTGAAAVIEETNLSPNIFLAEVQKILSDEGLRQKMSGAARGFAKPNAAADIAKVVLAV